MGRTTRPLLGSRVAARGTRVARGAVRVAGRGVRVARDGARLARGARHDARGLSRRRALLARDLAAGRIGRVEYAWRERALLRRLEWIRRYWTGATAGGPVVRRMNRWIRGSRSRERTSRTSQAGRDPDT
ncbi:hypothetical protein [Streptomyces sp. DH12]|uniref:hypothetical protein n=1 Tax=Streptomyces sp. DH12 TaxID=2857010 RepID=UPI001E6318F6|nr:hypothetical protein [Streptomyces sp. DH12]